MTYRVRQAGRVMYLLDEVLVLCLLAVLAGAETITDIARIGDKKLDLLRRFRPFAEGTPAHDHLGDILAILDSEQFQRCFVAWVASLIGAPEGVVAIGKTSRRSKGAAREAIHMVSAFAAPPPCQPRRPAFNLSIVSHRRLEDGHFRSGPPIYRRSAIDFRVAALAARPTSRVCPWRGEQVQLL